MNDPAQTDFLYRSQEARRIFTQPSLLGAALMGLQGAPALLPLYASCRCSARGGKCAWHPCLPPCHVAA
jgi:hypothetical protein